MSPKEKNVLSEDGREGKEGRGGKRREGEKEGEKFVMEDQYSRANEV